MVEACRHCAKCGLASVVASTHYADGDAAVRTCRLDLVCAYLDEVEFECEETRVLPRIVLGDE